MRASLYSSTVFFSLAIFVPQVFALPQISALPQVSALEEASANDDVEEIVVTGRVTNFGATKSAIPILETARSVSVIDASKFLERGSLTLDDTLNYTAGVIGDTFGFSTRGDFPRVRGLDVPEYLDNIQVLFGYYNNARSDIYALEQVEVLKGPASVLYGQGSPGGILNTVSKRAGRDNLDREIVLDVGTHDRVQAAADIGFDLSGNGNLTGRMVALYRDSATQVNYVNDDALVLAPSITYQNDQTTLTALINYTDRSGDSAHQFLPLTVSGCASTQVIISEPNICSSITGKKVDPSVYSGHPDFNKYDTRSFSATIFAEQVLGDVFTFEATARYRDNEANYKQTWITFLGAGTPRTLPDGTAVSRTWYDSPGGSDQFAVDARIRATFDTGVISHEVLTGVNYQNVNTHSNSAYIYQLPTTFNYFSPAYDKAEVPTAATLNAVRAKRSNNTSTLGFYVNDQISVGDFILNAGVRFDNVDNNNGTTIQKDSATSFSVGALYKTSIGLNPYVSYAESFLAVVGADNTTNKALKPQRGKQIEVGVKYQPPGTRTYVTAAYFDIKQSNLSNPAGLPDAPSQQEGVAKIKGFELEAQTIIGDLYLDGNFSVLETKNPDGVPLPNIPKYFGSAWATWKPSSGEAEGFRVGLGIRYEGKDQSHGVAYLAANGFAPKPVKVETNGYTVFDALIGYSFEKIDLTLNARNMFDTKYYGACLARGDCFPGEGRTVVLRAAYRF